MIILGRHGNTFQSSSESVWVGSSTDLELTNFGRTQAFYVIKYMEVNNFEPKIIISAPLKRTVEYSEIIANHFEADLIIDIDLIELNYGLWEGRNNDYIIKEFGCQALLEWEQQLVWPNISNQWGEDFDTVLTRVGIVLNKLSKYESDVFVCTSNGILRFIYYILKNERDASQGKVKTGNICVLANKCLELMEWNFTPPT